MKRVVITVTAAMCAATLVVAAQSAPPRALPLENLGLEHLDIVVPDVAATAKFYNRIFKSAVHQQPIRDSFRYFILLGDLPADRQVGYIAIGAANGRAPAIGHYCVLATTYNATGFGASREAAGLPSKPTAQGGFGMWPDPDGLELQLFQPPAGLVTGAVPSDLPVEANGLVMPLGLDHVELTVRDINASLPYYHFVYGKDVDGARDRNPDRLWLNLKADTRIGLQQAPAGQSPRIEHFCIKVRPFDREAVTAGLKKIGAEVLASTDEPGVVRFLHNNRIMVELKAT